MVRRAEDLPLILRVIAGKNAHLLGLDRDQNESDNNKVDVGLVITAFRVQYLVIFDEEQINNKVLLNINVSFPCLIARERK